MVVRGLTRERDLPSTRTSSCSILELATGRLISGTTTPGGTSKVEKTP